MKSTFLLRYQFRAVPNIIYYIALIRWYVREAYLFDKRMELVHMIGITDIMSVAHMSKGNRH